MIWDSSAEKFWEDFRLYELESTKCRNILSPVGYENITFVVTFVGRFETFWVFLNISTEQDVQITFVGFPIHGDKGRNM